MHPNRPTTPRGTGCRPPGRSPMPGSPKRSSGSSRSTTASTELARSGASYIGIAIGCDRVWRLMREAGLHGVRRGTKTFTTRPYERANRPPDLVCRDFTAEALNRLWVADVIYVRTWAELGYVACVEDVFSRMVVGWSLATHPAGHPRDRGARDGRVAPGGRARRADPSFRRRRSMHTGGLVRAPRRPRDRSLDRHPRRQLR
jgi:transposase InsO family protein